MPLLLASLVPLSLILLLAPSGASVGRHQRSLSTQPILLRTLLIVNTTSNDLTPGDGLCSLRKAITTSNGFVDFVADCGTGSGFDTIKFTVSGTITITGSALPAILNNLIIDGTGQTIAVDGVGSFQVFAVNPGATLTLNDLTIQNGAGAMLSGGGIGNKGTLSVTNCKVSGNSGAGIYSTGTLNLTGSTISSNADGGIVNGDNATLNVTNSTISDNTTGIDPGVGISSSGTLTVNNSTISGNSGGGIGIEGFFVMGVSTTVTNSTVSSNSGSGLANFFATMTVSNSTIADNSSTSGGGIANQGILTVTNCTISSNSASSSLGGGIFNTGMATFKNTIMANPAGGNCAVSGSPSPLISDGHNLQDDTTCFFTNNGDINNTPAGLDPKGLQDNGGPTKTIALLADSPAIDAVPISPTNFCTAIDGTTPITTDQRGNARLDAEDSDLVNPACDIGAFEASLVDSATPTATATATQTATATATASSTATATATTAATATATPSRTPTPTTTATATSSATPSRTATPSVTATATPSASATASPTRTATATASPTATRTATPTATPTGATPTSTPTPVAGKLKVAPKTLKFGAVTVDQAVTKTVTVTNAGKTTKKKQPPPILIEMETVDGMPTPSPFSLTTQCDDDNLMPSGKGVPKSETMCKIAVQFKPTEVVSYSGTLMIFDNLQPSEMETVQITGKGK